MCSLDEMGNNDPPPYTTGQDGKVCILTIGEGVITALGREVKVRLWENSPTQKWKIETSDNRCAFRNLSTGRLLSIHVFGNITAGVYNLNEWELFTLEPVVGGYRFKAPNYWLWGQGFIVRPSLSDSLQISYQRTRYSPINLTYVDCHIAE